MKSAKDKVKDALGVKGNADEEEKAGRKPEPDEEEDVEEVEEEDEEAPVPAPHHPGRPPGRPPLHVRQAQSIPQKHIERKPVQQAREEATLSEKVEAEPVPQRDIWLEWLKNNQVISVADVSVYKKPDGSRVIACIDATGSKSILNCGLHLSKDVLEKIMAD